eukprot:1474356-Rhodomonas_salina.2
MHQPEPSQEDEDGSTRSMDPIGNVQSGKKFAQRQQHRWGQVNTFMTQMDVWHSGGNQFHLTREGSSKKGWRPTSSESGRLDREFVNLNLVMQSQTRALPKVVAEVLVDDDSLLALSRNADEVELCPSTWHHPPRNFTAIHASLNSAQQSRMKPHRRGLQSEVYERQSIPSRPPSSALMTLVPDSYERNPHRCYPLFRVSARPGADKAQNCTTATLLSAGARTFRRFPVLSPRGCCIRYPALICRRVVPGGDPEAVRRG